MHDAKMSKQNKKYIPLFANKLSRDLNANSCISAGTISQIAHYYGGTDILYTL